MEINTTRRGSDGTGRGRGLNQTGVSTISTDTVQPRVSIPESVSHRGAAGGSPLHSSQCLTMGGACARFTCPLIVPCWAPPMWPVPITFGPGPQTGAVRVGQGQGTRRTLRGSSRGQQGDRGVRQGPDGIPQQGPR